jgi:hypothetical protein
MVSATIDQLRWNQLRKQYSFGENQSNFYEITKSQLGLHSTDYWTPYLSIWARIGDYNAREVFEALNSGKHLLRTHAFRLTVHVIHQENYPMIISALGPRLYKYYSKHPRLKALSDNDVGKLIQTLVSLLEDEPLRMREIKQAMPQLGDHTSAILNLATAQGKVVRATTPHAKSTLSSYVAASTWLPDLKMDDSTEKEAIIRLLLQYIDTFGPVTIDDFSWWLPLSKSDTKENLETISENVIECEINGNTGYMTTNDYEMASSLDQPSDHLVWFLPYEDHFPKAFILRHFYIDEETKEKLLPKSIRHYWPPDMTPPPQREYHGPIAAGQIRPSIWLDGKIIGRWEMEEKNDEFQIVRNIYRKVSREIVEIINRKQNDLEEFINKRLVPISKK